MMDGCWLLAGRRHALRVIVILLERLERLGASVFTKESRLFCATWVVGSLAGRGWHGGSLAKIFPPYQTPWLLIDSIGIQLARREDW